MTEKLGVNEKEPAFGQKTPTTTTAKMTVLCWNITWISVHSSDYNFYNNNNNNNRVTAWTSSHSSMILTVCF